MNPGKQESSFVKYNKEREYKLPWNKGLTKETDQRVLQNAMAISNTLQQQIKDRIFVPTKMGEKARKVLSEKQSLQNVGGRCKWYSVNGIKVQGTWERDVALKLSDMGIIWVKPSKSSFIIKYEMEGKIKSYTPDFYLPEFNIFLEIKGYWWGKDKEKMKCVIEQNPTKNIVIVEKNAFKNYWKVNKFGDYVNFSINGICLISMHFTVVSVVRSYPSPPQKHFIH